MFHCNTLIVLVVVPDVCEVDPVPSTTVRVGRSAVFDSSDGIELTVALLRGSTGVEEQKPCVA